MTVLCTLTPLRGTCFVQCDHHKIPRVAQITAVDNDTSTVSVEFLGDKFLETDPDSEDDVEMERITPQIGSYLTYYNKLRAEFPEWLEFAKLLGVFHGSSAAAERVFSQLAQMFSKQQLHMLEKWVYISIALRYNKRDMLDTIPARLYRR